MGETGRQGEAGGGTTTEERAVSARVILPVIGHARRRGLDVSGLLVGLPFTEADLRRRDYRTTWPDFVRFWERAERLIGGPAAMEQMGVALTDVSPMMAFLGRIFHSLDKLYLQVGPRIARASYTNMRATAYRAPDGRYVYEMRTVDGSPIPISFGSASVGLLRGYPKLLGLPEAVVEVSCQGSLQRFVTTPPAPQSARRAPPPPPPDDGYDFETPEGVLDLLEHPAESARRLQDHGPRLLAAADLAALGEVVMEIMEAEFFCRAAALWAVTPGGSLRPVAERQPAGHQASRSRTLSVGGRVVGRLDVDGTVIGEGSAGDGDLATLLPWIAMALAARLEAGGRGGDSLSERASALGLTAREVEVLGWIRQGKSNPEIAAILAISPRTVHKHVEHLLQKLGAESRHAAACQALLWKWEGDPSRPA